MFISLMLLQEIVLFKMEREEVRAGQCKGFAKELFGLQAGNL